MSEHFYIRMYWDARRESCAACAARTSSALTELARISPRFRRWFHRGWSREDALRHEISTDIVSVAKLLEAGRNRRDDNNEPIEELGFSIDGWNGAPRGHSLGFLIGCGGYSPRVPNMIMMDLPASRELSGDLYNYPMLRQIMSILIRCFEPDWGVVSSHSLSDQGANSRAGKYTPGWLMYASSRRFRPLAPNRSYEVERIDNLGELAAATREAFDSRRPDHVRQALDLAEAMRHGSMFS